MGEVCGLPFRKCTPKVINALREEIEKVQAFVLMGTRYYIFSKQYSCF